MTGLGYGERFGRWGGEEYEEVAMMKVRDGEWDSQFAIAFRFGNGIPHCVARSTPFSFNSIVLPIFPGGVR